MERVSPVQKEEIQARICSLDYSGIEFKLSYNLTRHFKSYVGRDFKAVAQVALHLLTPYMLPHEKTVWFSLSKVSCNTTCDAKFMFGVWIILQVFKVAYCQHFKLSNSEECQQVCEKFVRDVQDHFPELQKVKIHLILHMPQHMKDFGPASIFNTERWVTNIKLPCQPCFLKLYVVLQLFVVLNLSMSIVYTGVKHSMA